MKSSRHLLSNESISITKTDRHNCRKKKLLLLSLCMGLLSMFAVHAGQNGSNAFQKQPTAADLIYLNGKLETGGLRSGGDAITAEVWEDAIAVTFHKDVGELLIAITDESCNTVFETTINTSVQQQVLIPLSGLSSGIYTITFSNDRGEMWGEFEII